MRENAVGNQIPEQFGRTLTNPATRESAIAGRVMYSTPRHRSGLISLTLPVDQHVSSRLVATSGQFPINPSWGLARHRRGDSLCATPLALGRVLCQFPFGRQLRPLFC